ncbi:hypothetical protein ACFCW7_10890 [Paenibacillus glucanolyticus]|uniref:hypothetical protein n=1 Tax=Bacillati TaxID=1783272 RepID=UPI0035D6FC78
MVDVKIYLKSGQIVEFTAREFEVDKDSGGRMKSIAWNTEWNTEDSETYSLRYVDANQIAAITTKTTPLSRIANEAAKAREDVTA